MSKETENGKRARTRAAQSEHESAREPVAPSNTTGSYPIKILRADIDSLYLSYEGSFLDGVREEFESLKKMAQSDSQSEKSQAQMQIGDHILEVSGKGKGAYPYFLQDNAFGIKTGVPDQSKFPWASVQCQSELLAFQGSLVTERLLASLLREIGKVTVDPGLSRVDICVDFTTEYDLSTLTSKHIICKSRKIAWYEEVEFTGFTVGLGSPIAFRLYDKTREIEKSKKDWLLPLWKQEGWNGQSRVYRAEFQIKRKVLKELDITHFSQLMPELSALWFYAANWLKLAIPQDSDSHRERWPLHPIWPCIMAAFDDGKEYSRLERFSNKRVPRDEYLFRNGLSGIYCFMAKHGITDAEDGVKRYLEAASKYHRRMGSLDAFLEAKAREKGRKYNTLLNTTALSKKRGQA